jgi:hypothetical protein
MLSNAGILLFWNMSVDSLRLVVLPMQEPYNLLDTEITFVAGG